MALVCAGLLVTGASGVSGTLRCAKMGELSITLEHDCALFRLALGVDIPITLRSCTGASVRAIGAGVHG